MNCVRVEKLLALHAGGDLGPAESQAVTEHLAACAACRETADAFDASRQFMTGCEPPEFDAAFFESVRQSVMREIGTSKNHEGFTARLASLFTPRAFAYSALLVLLAAAALLALNVWSGKTDEASRNQTTASSDTNGNVPASQTIKDETPARADTPHPTLTPDQNQKPRLVFNRHQREPRMSTLAKIPKRKDENRAPATSFRLLSDAPSEMAKLSSQMDAGGPAVDFDSLDADHPARPERKLLRIELQTQDPNVRIIWLSPQTAREQTRD